MCELDWETALGGPRREPQTVSLWARTERASAQADARPSGHHGVGDNVGFVDGQVAWFGVEVDYDAYRRMLTPSDEGAGLSREH